MTLGKVATLVFCMVLHSALFASLLAQPAKTLAHKNDASEEPSVLREKTQIVSLSVSVTDRDGHPILGLGKNDLEIYEDKVKQSIEYFAETDIPLSIGIIFDVSASMESKLNKAKEAIATLIENSHQDDDYFLITFSDQAKLVADYSTGDQILTGLSRAEISGNTAMYDAIYMGLEKLKESNQRKKVLIVITDGEDNASRYSLRNLKQALKESDVQIFSFSTPLQSGSSCGHLCQMYAQRALEEITSITGGRAFFPLTMADLENATNQTAIQLRRQYSVGYTSTHTARDGKWRKIQMRTNISSEKTIVRTREGYYPLP